MYMSFRFSSSKPFVFILPIFILVIVAMGMLSCKKEKFLTDGGQVAFSTDTLKFDTVFTTLGSVTRSFKIYNTNNRRIKFDQIRLAGGSSSPFRMNIDGTPTQNISNIELAANDSLYVFVAMTIDPTTGKTPFLIQDAVEVTLNGQVSDVQLEAYGQDAHYIVDSVLTSQTWVNDKPYVIIHSALVDSGEVLTIQKGCRIYMHADSKLYVGGTLYTYGTKTDSVIFQGDRLDRDYFGYKDYPGEWRGIHFLSSSKQNNLNFTIIKNGGLTDAAVYVQPPWVPLGGPIVEFNHCTIANSAGFGILCFNTNIRANNCLIHTCGQQNVALIEGGEYEFNHCTMATYGGTGINHAQQPTVAVLNYRDISLTDFVGANLTAKFTNCIIYGPLDDELFMNKKGTWDYNVSFENCLVKRTNPWLVAPVNSIINQDPQFEDISKWDYHIKSTSPAKGSGTYQPQYPTDLDFLTRLNPPSIGCYEAK
jgi:hypothetical protein